MSFVVIFVVFGVRVLKMRRKMLRFFAFIYADFLSVHECTQICDEVLKHTADTRIMRMSDSIEFQQLAAKSRNEREVTLPDLA